MKHMLASLGRWLVETFEERRPPPPSPMDAAFKALTPETLDKMLRDADQFYSEVLRARTALEK